MNTIVLVFTISVFASLLLSPPLSKWLLENTPTNRISNETWRRFAENAISALAFPAIMTVGFAIFGLSYGLGNFLFLWALLYLFPPKP